MAKKTTKIMDALTVRFPPALRSRLRKEAEKNTRTLNQEMIHRLQASLKADARQLELTE